MLSALLFWTREEWRRGRAAAPAAAGAPPPALLGFLPLGLRGAGAASAASSSASLRVFQHPLRRRALLRFRLRASQNRPRVSAQRQRNGRGGAAVPLACPCPWARQVPLLACPCPSQTRSRHPRVLGPPSSPGTHRISAASFGWARGPCPRLRRLPHPRARHRLHPPGQRDSLVLHQGCRLHVRRRRLVQPCLAEPPRPAPQQARRRARQLRCRAAWGLAARMPSSWGTVLWV